MVTFSLTTEQKALLVPKDALVLGRGSPVVFVVDRMPKGGPAESPPPKGNSPVGPPPDGMVRRVPVELGAATEDLIEVRGPLEPGERVVVEGNERMFPGQLVSIVKSAAPEAEAPAADPGQ